MSIDFNKTNETESAMISLKEMCFFNSFIGKILRQFFKLEKYKADCDMASKDGFFFNYKYSASGFQFNAYEVGTQRILYPMRYYSYPNIDDEFDSVTWAPNQEWMLGFVEKLIVSLDRHLLKIIDERGEEYLRLTRDSEEKFEFGVQNPTKPDEWGKKIESIKKANLSKNMLPAHLCFNRATAKEIKLDIEKLLLSP